MYKRNRNSTFAVSVLAILTSVSWLSAAAPTYNVAIGSTFEVNASDLAGVDAFYKKPIVYIIVDGKNKSAKVRTKVYSEYGTTTTVECEWKKKVVAGTYSLVLQPKIKGEKPGPEMVTDAFTIEEPVILPLSPNSGLEGDIITVTGEYFGTKPPKAWFTYTDPVTGKAKKKICTIDKKILEYLDANGKSSCMNIETGESKFTFTVPKRITKEIECTFYLENKNGKVSTVFNPASTPVAYNQSVTVNKSMAQFITLSAMDPGAGALTYTVETNPSNGTLSGTAPDLIYNPTTGYTGSDSFTFKANNGTADSNTATVSITVNSVIVDGIYLVVDLSTGLVSEVSTVPFDLLTNEAYKTTKMVLRNTSAGSFTMGSPIGELGRYTDETQHTVTLTKEFYIGVFEVTQKQYQMVMGSNPSSHAGDKRPVESVSWTTIRGGTWPSGDPDPASFMGKLRLLTILSGSYAFDLPTEARWEYACRAGTTKAYNNDTDCQTTAFDEDSNLEPLAWYYYNIHVDLLGEHQEVGLKQVNNWGLYDMHGNVQEWCLDCYQSDLGSSGVTDPEGAPTVAIDADRLIRGGNWNKKASDCRSAERMYGPANTYPTGTLGFRVVTPVPIP